MLEKRDFTQEEIYMLDCIKLNMTFDDTLEYIKEQKRRLKKQKELVLRNKMWYNIKG